MIPATPTRRPVLCAIVLALITLAATGRIVFNDFSGWDDPDNFTNNPRLNPPTSSAAFSYFYTPVAGLYAPVTYDSWLAIAALTRTPAGELHAWPFHLASVIAHLLATLVAFQLLDRLLQAPLPAATGAMLFGAHPLQIESVAWASGLKDVLCGLFSMLAMAQYLRAAQSDRPWSRHYIAGAVFFVLAMLSKPAGVVVPVMAGVIDLLILRRPARLIAQWLAPWLLAAIPVLVVARLVQETGGQFAPPWWQRSLIATDALAFYMAKLVYPINLGLDYGRSPGFVLRSGAAYWTWLIPVAVCVMIVATRSRWLMAALLLFVVALSPVLGLTPFQQQFNSTVADHYMYLAMIGPALAVAWLASHLKVRLNLIAGAILALAFIALSSKQAGIWRNEQTLFGHALDVNPNSAMAHNNVGTALAKAGDLAGAAEHFRATLRTVPVDPTAHRNLALAMMRMNDIDGAIEQLAESIRLTESAGKISDDHFELARMLGSRGRFAEAADQLEIVLRRHPENQRAAALLQDARARAAKSAATQPR
jgi:tetratricopeptide (TPR) repeat protein